MSNYSDFFNIVKSDYITYEKTVKTFFKDYGKLVDLLNALFQWVPREFFILLIVSVLLLALTNSLSSTTKKINFVFSVVATIAFMAILNKLLIGRYRIISISKASLLLVIPAIVYYISLQIYVYTSKYFRKRKLAHPGSIERSIFNLQMTYNECMAQAHLLLSDGNYDAAKLKERIHNLKVSSDGLLRSLEKQEEEII